ncbi:hypothetical protein ARMGADRAFT_1166908 [Armillaria gallica]|uniref:Uncharacterized protein n=1 Tax=Armillaria gallica TaxID=47427 RepID=A0A2H3D5R2_ARMGA|nr:hypothetical protein ARMGADRAFT_1166908 [Armillaria gallica]
MERYKRKTSSLTFLQSPLTITWASQPSICINLQVIPPPLLFIPLSLIQQSSCLSICFHSCNAVLKDAEQEEAEEVLNHPDSEGQAVSPASYPGVAVHPALVGLIPRHSPRFLECRLQDSLPALLLPPLSTLPSRRRLPRNHLRSRLLRLFPEVQLAISRL